MRNFLKLNLCWKNHITFFSYGVQKVQKDAQKIIFSSKVAKFTAKIWMDLIMIFYIDSFFCATLSFWDIVNFSYDCVHIVQVFFVFKNYVFELRSILCFQCLTMPRLSVAGFAKYAVDANLFRLGSSLLKKEPYANLIQKLTSSG